MEIYGEQFPVKEKKKTKNTLWIYNKHVVTRIIIQRVIATKLLM